MTDVYNYGSGISQSGELDTLNGVTVYQAPTPPSFLQIEADFQQAYSTTDFAQQHASVADAYIAKMGELAAALVPPVINPQFPINPNAPSISTPAAPSLLPIDYVAPVTPAPFTGTLDLTGDDFPSFDATPPSLIFPNAPTPDVIGSLPVTPSVDLNFTYPTVDVELPAAPGLISINVPSFDGVTFPTFDAEAPVINLVAPQIVQYVPNAPYTDALLSGLISECQTRIATGVTGTNTGLPAIVEENLWNRGRDRDAKQLRDDLDGLQRMETMGYAMPPGVFIDNQIKIRMEYGEKNYGTSREIMIKQAELEQENIKNAMSIATQIESKLIDYANLAEQRRFDACKYVTDAGVQIYNAGVQAYSARVQGYRAAVDVYTAQISGARAIVEIYSAEIQAEKLKVDANTAIIEQYKAMVEAAMASIQVFEGEIKLVQLRADIEKTKVDIYGEQIKAYAATVNVFTSEVEAYKAQISAESEKEQIYSTQAQVYGTLVDATYKTITAKIETFKAELAEKTEEYDAFKALVESQAENVKAIAAANSSTADIYRAEVTGTSAYNEAMIKEWEAINTLTVQIQQVYTSAAEANGKMYLTAKSVATDAAKVGAQVEAQIAASGLGAVTWATHRSRQDNNSRSISANYGQSASVSASSGTNDNTSHNQNFNVNTSNSNSTIHQINSVE